MPFGYGKIVGDKGNTAATATFDTVTFGSDEWLTATVSEDKVVYSHDYPAMKDDTTSTLDLNGNRDYIVLETLTHDEKGHIVNVNKETVTLPYGYKTIKAANTADTVVDAPAITINANGQVSHHNSVRKALKSNPIIVLQERGLIVKQ